MAYLKKMPCFFVILLLFFCVSCSAATTTYPVVESPADDTYDQKLTLGSPFSNTDEDSVISELFELPHANPAVTAPSEFDLTEPEQSADPAASTEVPVSSVPAPETESDVAPKPTPAFVHTTPEIQPSTAPEQAPASTTEPSPEAQPALAPETLLVPEPTSVTESAPTTIPEQAPTPEPTPEPTATPEPTPEPTPTPAPQNVQPYSGNTLTISVETTGTPVSVSGSSLPDEVLSLIEQINLEREAAGLPALAYDSNLCETALVRAAEITVSWSHIRPNSKRWTSLSDLINGENLAYGYDSVTSVLETWMDSAGHRELILNEDFTRVGAGILRVDGIIYWVVHFGY